MSDFELLSRYNNEYKIKRIVIWLGAKVSNVMSNENKIEKEENWFGLFKSFLTRAENL